MTHPGHHFLGIGLHRRVFFTLRDEEHTVEVHPAAYYEGLYSERLAAKLPAATRAAYETALSRARSSHYVAEQFDVVIGLHSKQ